MLHSSTGKPSVTQITQIQRKGAFTLFRYVTDLQAHGTDRPVEAISIHHLGPCALEGEQKQVVVRSEFLGDGQIGRVVFEVQIGLGHEELLAYSLVLRQSVGQGKRLPIVVEQSDEVFVGEGGGVGGPGAEVSQAGHLARGSKTCGEGHCLIVRETQLACDSLHLRNSEGVVAIGWQEIGSLAIRGIRAATTEVQIIMRLPGSCRTFRHIHCFLEGHSARQHNEISPRQGEAVVVELIVNRSQNLHRLVHADIEGPIGLRSESNASAVGSAEVVGLPEGRSSLPSQVDKEGTIIGTAVVGIRTEDAGGISAHHLDNGVTHVVKVR